MLKWKLKMRKIEVKNTYKQDLKIVLKQGWDKKAINDVIKQLSCNDILDSSLNDHKLQGDYKDFRECHVKADLVIIYQRDSENLSLFRIGRHQNLFKKY